MSINYCTGFFAVGFALANLAPAPARAENFGRGQELYENHCQACHENLLHLGEDRKVKTLSDLRERIRSWAIHAGDDWGNGEVDDVLFYLNKTFYRFKGEAL